jgi:hypothetical protein
MDQSTKNILFIGASSVGIYLLWNNYNKNKTVVKERVMPRTVTNSVKLKETPTDSGSDINTFFEPVILPIKDEQANTLVANQEIVGGKTQTEPVLIPRTR